METYFRSTDESYGGMICRGETGMDDMFDTMDGIYQSSFEDIGGDYIPRDENETTCAIRVPPNRFFEVILQKNSCICPDNLFKERGGGGRSNRSQYCFANFVEQLRTHGKK